MTKDFWDGYVPEPSKPAPVKGEGMISDPDEYDWKCDCAKCEERYRHWKNDFDTQQKALRNEALDKRAENARELGLDYEPVPENFIDALKFDVAMRDAAQPAPMQEPVGYLCENAVGHKYFRWKKPSSEFKPIALYTTPLAAQRQWVGLTDEEKRQIFERKEDYQGWLDYINTIEAKLKERNI
jgi:hypothetical protein